MSRTTTICALILSVALARTAGAAPSNEEKCQAAKLNALRKRTFCIEGERRKHLLGTSPDSAKCEAKFATAIAKADDAAAHDGTACRWLENDDGTATDLNSGLQWELKTDDGSVHDLDNIYTWSKALGRAKPNGTAFTTFLAALNGGVSAHGRATTGCFAGHCDWRLPTIGELRGIVAKPLPCVTPCTTIPGFTLLKTHWTSSTHSNAPAYAWEVYFGNGTVFHDLKSDANPVRAVRGGS